MTHSPIVPFLMGYGRPHPRLIPEAERVIIPDASHEIFLDVSELTAEIMARHFRGR
jgi:pimeloyl-ACP methyl ester carboxylesterase